MDAGRGGHAAQGRGRRARARMDDRGGRRDGKLYAGGDPGVLLESGDGGESWTINQALWNEPSRPDWTPGGGGLCIHSIVPWPGDPERLALGISAAGVWLTDDGGASWRRGNAGLSARYVPEEMAVETNDLCIHAMARAPGRQERLFMQFHGGVYLSDDAGESWTDIAPGLPSDFSFPLAVDPADPDSAFVIPLTAETDRVTVDGRAHVFATRDAGATWTALGDGPSRTPISRCCATRSPPRGREPVSSCTSARPRGRSSAPATPARAGQRSHPACRWCQRS